MLFSVGERRPGQLDVKIPRSLRGGLDTPFIVMLHCKINAHAAISRRVGHSPVLGHARLIPFQDRQRGTSLRPTCSVKTQGLETRW
jgi:hypothetical protein